MEENNDNVKEEEPNKEINNDDVIDVNEEEISVVNDTVKISNDAIATYAGIAILEVQGVYSMAGTFSGITEALSGKKNLSRGIKVDSDEKSAKIDINIIVEYGARIPEVAFEIQNRVKKSVETMTGLKVSEVNVHVQGVHAISEKDAQNQEENEQEETNNSESNEDL
jgi:uncharacterized alkaline shock family protein YloU